MTPLLLRITYYVPLTIIRTVAERYAIVLILSTLMVDDAIVVLQRFVHVFYLLICTLTR